MSATTATTPAATVREFLLALQGEDVDAAMALVADDIHYANVPYPPMLGRSRLERVIRDFDLYKEHRARGALMEDVVQRMRTQDIGVETLKGDAFRVSYVGSNPQVVMRVTDRLASMFIDENLRDRELAGSA